MAEIKCPYCGGKLELKYGRYGYYIECIDKDFILTENTFLKIRNRMRKYHLGFGLSFDELRKLKKIRFNYSERENRNK